MKKIRIIEVSTERRSFWIVQTRSLLWPFWRMRQCCPHPADAHAAAALL